MMDPKIVFQDIECPNLRRQVNELMDEMFQVLPSDSAVRATFGFIHDRFVADIKVASESVYMTAIDQATALGDLLEHVRSKLMGQVIGWRSHRFAV